MSRNYELLQQIESERSESALPASFAAARNGLSAYPAVRWAGEEALRLVQQIFLPQTQEPPRVVVFAGIDHGNGCSQICAAVA